MKVVCINNGKVPGAKNDKVSLTIGQTYIVHGDSVSEYDKQFSILNDRGYRGNYHSDRFLILSDVRNSKLEDLGIK